MMAARQMVTHQRELEEAILAIVLHDFELVDSVYLNTKWFQSPVVKAVVQELQMNGRNVQGLMELYARVQSQLHDVTFSYQWLVDVESRFVTSANLGYLCRELHRNFLRQTLQELKVEHTKFPTPELESAMMDVLATIAKIGENQHEGDLSETFDVFEEQLESDSPTGVKTFGRMDSAFGGGLQAGALVTIGARPSVGKSAFAVNLIEKALQRNPGLRVDLFSLEMSKKEVLARFVALHTGIFSSRLRNMNKLLLPKQKEAVRDAIAYYKTKDIKVYDDVSYLNRIVSVIKERASTAAVDQYLVIIDYLGLIRVNNTRMDRRLQIEEITRELKVLANEAQIPIIILSQLSRGVEQRQDKSPLLSDLRESGSIEQDSNVVGFLTNVDTEENREGYQRVEFQIKKNREGDLVNLSYKFYKAKMKFEEEFV